MDELCGVKPRGLWPKGAMVELLMEVKNSIEGDTCLRGRSRIWCSVRTWRLKMSVEGCHKEDMVPPALLCHVRFSPVP